MTGGGVHAPRAAVAVGVLLVAAVVGWGVVARTGGERAGLPVGTSAADDRAGDPKPTRLTEPLPADVDLLSVSVALEGERARITFVGTGPSPGDAMTRIWAWRAWGPSASRAVLTVYVHGRGDMMASAGVVYACTHDRFCGEEVPGARVQRAGARLSVELPGKALEGLPPRFRWAAMASAKPNAYGRAGWDDAVPGEELSPHGAVPFAPSTAARP